MSHRFGHCRTRDSLLTRLELVAYCFFVQPRFETMVCKKLRLSCDDVLELLLKQTGDAGMELLASVAQQSAVDHVLNKGMLKNVSNVRRFSSLEDQLCTNQLPEASSSCRFGMPATELISS